MKKPMRYTSWIVSLALLTALGGCAMFGGGEPPEPQDVPPKVSEEELQRQAEEKRLAEEKRIAEEKKKEEERRIAEENRQSAEIKELLGPAVPPPPIVPEKSEQEAIAAGEIPFDDAVPPLPTEPSVRVAVFSHESEPEKGGRVALIIGAYSRGILEEKLGASVKIAYVSQLKKSPTRNSAIRFRPNFLKAAQTVAAELPQAQTIEPMSSLELRQKGVDLIVYVGKDFR